MEHWHGTNNGYSNRRCRCEPCRLAHNRYMRDYKRLARIRAIPDAEHGFPNTYWNKGCRCAPCSRAAAGRKSSVRLLKNANPRPPIGTPCESCGKPPANDRPLHLDHDHETEEFRGWLCSGCNTAIGKLGDTVEGVRAALNYLLRAAERSG